MKKQGPIMRVPPFYQEILTILPNRMGSMGCSSPIPTKIPYQTNPNRTGPRLSSCSIPLLGLSSSLII